MKSRSTIAKLRLGATKDIRSRKMRVIAKLKQASLTPQQRYDHAMKMVEAKRKKRMALSLD